MRLKTAKCLTKCHNQKTFKNHMKNAMFLASWLGNITDQKDLRSNTFRGTTHSPGWKEYLSQKKSNSSGTIARLQVCISGLILLLLLLK
jgi:hypothetical protein